MTNLSLHKPARLVVLTPLLVFFACGKAATIGEEDPIGNRGGSAGVAGYPAGAPGSGASGSAGSSSQQGGSYIGLAGSSSHGGFSGQSGSGTGGKGGSGASGKGGAGGGNGGGASNQGPENTKAKCSDGEDNDGDNFIDCNDKSCCAIVDCKPGTYCGDLGVENSKALCSDGKDNDGDGYIDCGDSNCCDLVDCKNKPLSYCSKKKGYSALGLPCTNDSDCGEGMVCYEEGKDVFENTPGGPAKGICSASCTVDADCGFNGVCWSSTCMLGCHFGINEPKCQGRTDMACVPASFFDTPPSSDLCIFRCSSDSQCSAGRVCDRANGVCVAPSVLDGLMEDGAPCVLGVNSRQCKGFCGDWFGLDAVYKPQQSHGTCTSGCTVGMAGQCGGAGSGACFYTQKDESGHTSQKGDAGLCAKRVTTDTDDKNCDMEGGFFAESTDMGNLCLWHKPCETHGDCQDFGGNCHNLQGACGGYCMDREITWPANATQYACKAGDNCNCFLEPNCHSEYQLSCDTYFGICVSPNVCCVKAGSNEACL